MATKRPSKITKKRKATKDKSVRSAQASYLVPHSNKGVTPDPVITTGVNWVVLEYQEALRKLGNE